MSSQWRFEVIFILSSLRFVAVALAVVGIDLKLFFSAQEMFRILFFLVPNSSVTSLQTYFTQLCSTFLNKLTKLSSTLRVKTEKRRGVEWTKKKSFINHHHQHHPWMFIKNMINICTSSVRVYDDENTATSAL